MSGGNGQGRDDAFYALVLSGLGAPVNQANLSILRAWQKAEGGTASWNPFNTTAKMPGATPYNNNNGYPVMNYRSETDGVAATIKTLKLGYYKIIVAGLKASNPAIAISGIVASPWDGHYGAKRTSGGGWDYTSSSVYRAWKQATKSRPTSDYTKLPSNLKSGTGSGGTAYYDPESGALKSPNGQVWFPYTLWLSTVPKSTRDTIKVVLDPGMYAREGASKDAGGVTDVGVQAVDDTASAITSAISPITGLFSWVTDNMARIGLALLGLLVIVMGITYANRAPIKEAISTATKVAAVA